MKKTYQRPEIWVEEIESTYQVLADSPTNEIKKVDGNAELIYGGAGSGNARAGESNIWDEEPQNTWDGL